MSITNAKPRAWHDGNHFTWRAAAATGLLGLLVACGGGGSDAGSTGTPGATPIMRAEAQVGDYFTYVVMETTTVPASVPVSAYNSTVAYRSVAADGTNQRVTTWSTGQAAGLRTYDVNDAVVSNDSYSGSGVVICSYSPSAPVAPPYPRAVGQSWNGTSQFTCRVSSAAIVQAGQILARETLSLPAGIFDAYRAVRTSTATGATGVSKEESTCWYGVDRGVLLACNYTNTTTPVGSSTPASVISYTQLLTGLGGPNRVAQGVQLSRFQGPWNVKYSGGSSGTCNLLAVSASGDINGSCSNTASATFTVTGTVNESGVVNIHLPGGGALIGNLSTIYSGSGTWSDAGLTGTWTAMHN